MRALTLVPLVVFTAAALAQPLSAAPPPPVTVLVGSGTAAAATSTLSGRAATFAAGKPVPLVVVDAWPAALASGLEPPATAGLAWLPALQGIAASVSDPTDAPNGLDAIPFRLGSLWTIAPERMTVPRLPVGPLEPLSAMEPGRVLDLVARSLTPRQMALGDLAWSDFTDQQQRLLAAAFDRPATALALTNTGSGFAQRPVELPGGVYPIRRATLHLRLALSMWNIHDADGSRSGYFLQRYRSALDFRVDPSAPQALAVGTSADVPRALKPGDLNVRSAALNPPLGVSGSLTVKAVVEAAAKATRLPLRVDPRFGAVNAFVGDPALRTGYVLQALAFDLSGAWRKVGKTFLLTWDRMGYGAFDLLQRETLEPLTRSVQLMQTAAFRRGWATDVVTNVPSAPDGDFGPTASQRELLLRPPTVNPGPPSSIEGRTIGWVDLTPAQQAGLREMLSFRMPGNVAPIEEGSASSLSVIVTLEAPGLPDIQLRDALSTVDLRSVWADTAPGPMQASPDWPPKNVPTDGSLALPQPERGLAPPLLTRGEWPRLLAQMKRKGLNTLYFPVLWDGYATFPGKAFPLAAQARGIDLLDEVVRQAQPLGIRVVGVIHVLAWRFPGGSELHWLRRHPEWVDVDALGRTRREWATSARLRDPSGKGADSAEDPLIFSDMADPGNPAVRARLLSFCAELRARPGLSGVALAHWTRATSEWDGTQSAPMLGYSVEQRAAFLEKRGVDPIDIAPAPWADGATRLPFGSDANPFGVPGFYEWPQAQRSADMDLADALAADLRKGWPAMVAAFCPYAHPDSGSTGKPKVSLTLVSDPKLASERRWLPGPKECDPAPSEYAAFIGEEMAKANEDRRLRNAIRLQRLTGKSAAGFAGVVLDYTTAPDLLWDTLRLLKG